MGCLSGKKRTVAGYEESNCSLMLKEVCAQDADTRKKRLASKQVILAIAHEPDTYTPAIKFFVIILLLDQFFSQLGLICCLLKQPLLPWKLIWQKNQFKAEYRCLWIFTVLSSFHH